jgi:dihydroxyacetone kinase
LNGPGFSITLCNLTIAAEESKTSAAKLLELLADETKAPSWPNVLANTSTKVDRTAAPEVDIEKQTEISPEDDIKGEWP